MSNKTLRKVIKQRVYKERAQPLNRTKFGLLEKHKDYVDRAKRFRIKRDFINRLKAKADERNPDEYCFAMDRAITKDGVYDGRISKARLDTQGRYRTMMANKCKHLMQKAQQGERTVRRLQSSLHLIGANSSVGKHTVFVDGFKDAGKFRADNYFDTLPELLGRKFNRPRCSEFESGKIVSKPRSSKIEKKKKASFRKLVEQQEIKHRNMRLAQKYEQENYMMSDGTKKFEFYREACTIGKVIRWKKERKR